MKNLAWLFAAWLVGALASTALRWAYHWPAWQIAGSALIAVVSAVVLRLAATTPNRGRAQMDTALMSRLLLGWLVIQTINAVTTGNVAAGVDVLFYLPGFVIMLVLARGRRVRQRELADAR